MIAAAGPWNQPLVPDIPGLDGFAGEVFHSSRWNHDYDLSGKRVAVVGTGASAVQFVPLFKGTLDGWVVENSSTNNFTIVDKLLRVTGPPSWARL